MLSEKYMTKYTPSPGKTSLYTLPFHLTTLYYSRKQKQQKSYLTVESSFSELTEVEFYQRHRISKLFQYLECIVSTSWKY